MTLINDYAPLVLRICLVMMPDGAEQLGKPSRSQPLLDPVGHPKGIGDDRQCRVHSPD